MAVNEVQNQQPPVDTTTTAQDTSDTDGMVDAFAGVLAQMILSYTMQQSGEARQRISEAFEE